MPLSDKHKLLIFLFILPILIYVNTLNNDFALDDSIVYTQNAFVKEGFKGINKIFMSESFTGFFKVKKDLVEGGRYRPLSIATFAVEYELYGEKPGISHAINVFLYALLCLLLFMVFNNLLSFFNTDSGRINIAFVATLLFAVHPVHTEVVANIKGRDEILSGLFLLLSFQFALKNISSVRFSNNLLAGFFLFLALLSKENAIALIPLVGLLAVIIPATINRKPLYNTLIYLFAGSVLYLFIRYKVLGGFGTAGSQELMNNPFLEASNNQKLPTIFYTLLLYLKLCFIPYPLTYDYYPYHIQLQNWSDPLVIFSLIIHLFLVVIAIYHLKKNRVLSFAIFFYFFLLLPVSNLIFTVGTFMNERFLFLPTAGFTLIVASLLFGFLENKPSPAAKKAVVALLSCVVFTFSLLTLNRNNHWKNNFTLFTHDVKISKNSAKGNCAAGGILYETALTKSDLNERRVMLGEAKRYIIKSISIYPSYIDALLLLGNIEFELTRNVLNVIPSYTKIFALSPAYELPYKNLKSMLEATDNPKARITGYKIILNNKSGDFDANYQLGATYGKLMNNLDSAIVFLRRAVQIQPDNKQANRDLGVAYAMNGDYSASIKYLQKVIELSPSDPQNYINLGLSYQHIGKQSEAQAMFNRAEKLKIE